MLLKHVNNPGWVEKVYFSYKRALQNLKNSKKIILVDGEMFSWYGSRMKKAAQYFIDLRKNLSNI